MRDLDLGVEMTKLRMLPVQSWGDQSADSLSAEIAYWVNTGDLPPQLITGHPMIDREHRFLIASISNLRRICIDQARFQDCVSCGADQQRLCDKNLISLLGDVFAFILDHFKNEESIMRESLLLVIDRDLCQAHMEDHAEIAAKVQEIVSGLDRQHLVSSIRDLDALLSRWVTNHVVMHDMLLSRWIGRDDALLNRF